LLLTNTLSNQGIGWGLGSSWKMAYHVGDKSVGCCRQS
jgi:hypothetical protein